MLARRTIREGKLSKLPDGSLDRSLVGSTWRAGNRKGANSSHPEVQTGDGCLGLMPSGQRLIARKTFLLARGHRRPQFQRLVDHAECFKTRPSPSDREVAIVEQTTS